MRRTFPACERPHDRIELKRFLLTCAEDQVGSAVMAALHAINASPFAGLCVTSQSRLRNDVTMRECSAWPSTFCTTQVKTLHWLNVPVAFCCVVALPPECLPIPARRTADGHTP